MLISELKEEIDVKLGKLKKNEVARIETTLEEYFDLLPVYQDTEYNLLFDNDTTILTMSIASAAHEALTSNFIRLLGNYFIDFDEITVYGSGRVVYIPSCNKSFVPDAVVVFGQDELFPRKAKIPALSNPKIIVEVQSESTIDVDFGEKLYCYKQIPSVSEIVYASQHRAFVSVYRRTSNPKDWIVNDYIGADEMVKIQDFEIPMKEIYRKVVFDKTTKGRH